MEAIMKRMLFVLFALVIAGLLKPGCDLFISKGPDIDDTPLVRDSDRPIAVPRAGTAEMCKDNPGWKFMGYRSLEHCLRIAPGYSFDPLRKTVTDVDGNSYRIVQIGGQVWMAENLRVTRYQDGSKINSPAENGEWLLDANGIYGIYPHQKLEGLESDAEVAVAYGLLYDWHAVTHSKGLCPKGWRMPSESDWMELDHYLRSTYVDIYRGNVGGMLKSPRQIGSPLGEHWATEQHPRWDGSNHIGRDDFSFSGLPAGFRGFDGEFQDAGSKAFWWSSSACAATLPLSFSLCKLCSRCYNGNQQNQLAMSVRCIKNQ